MQLMDPCARSLGSVLDPACIGFWGGNPPGVKLFRTPQTMQRAARCWRKEAAPVGFVPTMGFLHEGHLSLVDVARRHVGSQGKVVVSIYVNPTQFSPSEDLSTYPRDLARDLRLCKSRGVDAVFLPTDLVMYPGRENGTYSTYVMEERLSDGMEGASRPTHFRGVVTIVCKLFNCVLPEVAIFGAKDWQQAEVVRRMTIDLNFPVKIVVAPTYREPDGLAMSSRNTYLTKDERLQATVLWRCIQHCRRRVRTEGQVSCTVLEDDIRQLIQRDSSGRLDYATFFDRASLRPVTEARRGTHLALAMFLGEVRLIDNSPM